ncbi:hypothetical protein ACTSKR_06990 [Chitinibacteraceae bacterium HSL-7]
MIVTLLGLAALLIAMAAFYYAGIYSPGAQCEWERWPDRASYQARHGHLHCCHCQSERTLDVGLMRWTDFRRKIICRDCKATLWREQD